MLFSQLVTLKMYTNNIYTYICIHTYRIVVYFYQEQVKTEQELWEEDQMKMSKVKFGASNGIFLFSVYVCMYVCMYIKALSALY